MKTINVESGVRPLECLRLDNITVTYGTDENTDKLHKLGFTKLRGILNEKGLKCSVTGLLRSKECAELRQEIVAELGL